MVCLSISQKRPPQHFIRLLQSKSSHFAILDGLRHDWLVVFVLLLDRGIAWSFGFLVERWWRRLYSASEVLLDVGVVGGIMGWGGEKPIAVTTVDAAVKSGQVKRETKLGTSASFLTAIYCQQTRQTGNNSLPTFTGAKWLHIRPAVKETRQLKSWCWQDVKGLHWPTGMVHSQTPLGPPAI